MSSDYNISYSFTLDGPAAQSHEPEAALYAFGDCREHPLGGGAVLLQRRDTGRQAVVTRDVAIALDHCRDFRSLEGHAHRLTAYMPELGGDADGVRQVLASVRDRGLLTAAADYARAVNDAPRAGGGAPPSRVFVITCDRPEAVARLLDSMLANAELARHEALFLVDDSRDAGHAARNRALVEDFNLRSPVPLRYFGLAEREALLERLLRELPAQAPALRFLLDREQWQGAPTYGLARNLCLLLSVGRRAIVLDDDVLCTAFDAPYNDPGLRFMEGICEAAFFPGPGAWRAQARTRREDPLRGHLRCLGLGLGDALDALALGRVEDSQLHLSEERLLRRLSAHSRVLVTQNGTYGDPGTGDLSWAFDLRGASLDRLLDQAAPVTAKLAARQFWMGWPQPTLQSRANMSQVTGLDHSALLPPYFPAWRGEDQLFGTRVEFLHPHSFVLNFPWAVPHLPLEPRTGSLEAHPEHASALSLVDSLLCSQLAASPLSPTDRLAHLAGFAASLAEATSDTLAGVYRSTFAEAQAHALRRLGDNLREAPAHEEWRGLLEARRQSYLAAVSRSEVPVQFHGVPAGVPEEDLWRRFRQLATGFAAALAAWPEVRAAAAACDPIVAAS